MSDEPLILEYRNPLLAPIPLIDPENAAKAILSGDRQNEFIRLFSTAQDAASYYSHFQTLRFGHDRVSGICAECRITTDETAVLRGGRTFLNRHRQITLCRYRWKATYPAYVSLCRPCLEYLQNKIAATRRATRIGLILEYAAIATSILRLAQLVTMSRPATDRQLALPLIAIAGCLLAIAFTKGVRIAVLPASMLDMPGDLGTAR